MNERNQRSETGRRDGDGVVRRNRGKKQWNALSKPHGRPDRLISPIAHSSNWFLSLDAVISASNFVLVWALQDLAAAVAVSIRYNEKFCLCV